MSDPKQQALLRAAFVAFLDKAVVKVEAPVTREDAAAHLEPGDATTLRSPLDKTPIARFTMTDPKPSAKVTDRAALEGWVRENYPEHVLVRTEIVGPMSAVLEVLRQHAPHLIEDKKSVPDWVVNELVTKSEKAGEAIGWGGELDVPGIEVSTPAPQLRITLSKDTAAAAFQGLWQAGRISLDGTVRQIEGGA